jgi:hypothetical protein
MRTPSPKTVLALAILLPGAGHLVQGDVRRALGFIFFMLILGWLTAHFAAPGVSFVGRHAGGFFVYALSITDAYRSAALARALTSATITR